jgi:hypothetical protein
MPQTAAIPTERYAALRRLARETRELAAMMDTAAAREHLLRSAQELDALLDDLASQSAAADPRTT